MSNPDTNNIGIKLQIAGENLNTWGDPNLNNDFIVVSNLASKFNSITINGDYNVGSNSTNYSTTNPDEVALIKLIPGTVTAAFQFIMAGRAKRVVVWNASGYAAQMKLAATTGFSLPNNRTALVSTDGVTDVYNSSPNYGGVAVPTSGSLDIPSWGAVQTAIATAGLPATSGTVLNSGTDTTAGYLSVKLTGSGAVVLSTTSPGGNEKTNIAVGALGLTQGSAQTTSFAAAVNTRYPLSKSGAVTVTLPAAPSVNDIIQIEINGTVGLVTYALNSLKYYGSTVNPVSAQEGVQTFYYTGASRGWIDS